MDIDKHINSLFTDMQCVPEKNVINICHLAIEILSEEPNVIYLSSPICVCGDTHGQFHDVREVLKGAPPSCTQYLFLGNYVNRGYYSVETIELLLLYIIKYPKTFHLIRGNHECKDITAVYGFRDEIYHKYGNTNLWKEFCRVFNMLPIAAVIDDTYFCVHSGLSPDICLIEEINRINRNQEIPLSGAFFDLLWASPSNDIGDWNNNIRGLGFFFGEKIAKEFGYINGIKSILRSHQLVNEGYQIMLGGKLVSIWSAPNYCYRHGNNGCIIKIQNKIESYVILKPLTIAGLTPYTGIFSYFA